MSIPVRSMSLMRCSTEVSCVRMASSCLRPTSFVIALEKVSIASRVGSKTSFVSAAASGVITWQWISTVALCRPLLARARSGEA